MLLAIRRCASSRPSLCGMSTSIGRSIGMTCGRRRCFSIATAFQCAMLRLLLTVLSMLFATPALAQVPQWNPAAPYITPGQDEPGYRAWAAGASWRPTYVKAFNDYLTTYGVGGVV